MPDRPSQDWEVRPRFAAEIDVVDLRRLEEAARSVGAPSAVAMLEEGTLARSLRMTVVVTGITAGAAVDSAIDLVRSAGVAAGLELGVFRDAEVMPAGQDPRMT